MNLNRKSSRCILAFMSVLTVVACQNSITVSSEAAALDQATATEILEPIETEEVNEVPQSNDPVYVEIPARSGPRTETSGSVPHVQIGVEPVEAVNEELYRLAFALPGVENRATIVSLPGARGMWLADGVAIVHPEIIVSGREFAHIHPDGSLHVSLPFERALEAVEKGWAERHPWADERDGWDGLVMLFTPQSMEELDVTIQLIIDSYNHVTGLDVQISDLNP
jgi:phospholipase/carboxylesterase